MRGVGTGASVAHRLTARPPPPTRSELLRYVPRDDDSAGGPSQLTEALASFFGRRSGTTHIERQYKALFAAHPGDVQGAFDGMHSMCIYTITDKDGVDETALLPAAVLDTDEPLTAASVARVAPPGPGERARHATAEEQRRRAQGALHRSYSVMHIMAAVGIDTGAFQRKDTGTAMFHVPLATLRAYDPHVAGVAGEGEDGVLLESRPAFSEARLAGEGEGGGSGDEGEGASRLGSSVASGFAPDGGGEDLSADDAETAGLRAKRALYTRMMQAVTGEGGVPTGMSMTASALRMRLAAGSALAQAFRGRRVVRFNTPDGAQYEYMLQNAYAVEAPPAAVLMAEAALTDKLAAAAAVSAGDRRARVGGVFVAPPAPGIQRLHVGGEIVLGAGFNAGDSVEGTEHDGTGAGARCCNLLCCRLAAGGDGLALGGFPGWGNLGLGGVVDEPLYVHYEVWLPGGSGWRWPPSMSAAQVAAVREGVTHAVRSRQGTLRPPPSARGQAGAEGTWGGGVGEGLSPHGSAAGGDAGFGGGVGTPAAGGTAWTVGLDGQTGEGDISLPAASGAHVGRAGLVTAGASESFPWGAGDGVGFSAPMGRGTASAGGGPTPWSGQGGAEDGITDVVHFSFPFDFVLEHVPALDTAAAEAAAEGGGQAGQEGAFVQGKGGFTPPTMPVLYLTVLSRGEGGQVHVRGYGAAPLPSAPGAHGMHVRTWMPQGTIRSKDAEFFLGGAVRLVDASAVGVPRDMYTRAMFEGGLSRHGLRTVDSGTLNLRLHTAYHINDALPRGGGGGVGAVRGGSGGGGGGAPATTYKQLLDKYGGGAKRRLRTAAEVIARITALMKEASAASAAVQANRDQAAAMVGRGARLRAAGTAVRGALRAAAGTRSRQPGSARLPVDG